MQWFHNNGRREIGVKKTDKTKFIKLASGYTAMLVITGVLAAVAFITGDQIEQNKTKQNAEKKEAGPAALPVKIVPKRIPFSDEQISALPLSAANDEIINTKCHRVGGNIEAKSCLEALRTELLQESARVWRNVLGNENIREPNPNWNSNPLTGNGIEKDNWERLCLTGTEKEYGTRDEPANYLRTPAWCLSTAQIAAEKYNIEYNTKHAEFLQRKVSAISRWELR